MRHLKQKDIDDLYVAITRLESLEECRKFMLSQGIPSTVIEDETGLSSRTIARVHKWLKQGKGGYTLMLKRLEVPKNAQ
jgi:uncharacterized protein YerC